MKEIREIVFGYKKLGFTITIELNRSKKEPDTARKGGIYLSFIIENLMGTVVEPFKSNVHLPGET